jgi:ankyrin repeat protein
MLRAAPCSYYSLLTTRYSLLATRYSLLSLLTAQANPSLGDKDGDTPLHLASALGMPHVAGILLAGGASLSQRMRNGFTPLHRAADNERLQPGHLETVQLTLTNPNQP